MAIVQRAAAEEHANRVFEPIGSVQVAVCRASEWRAVVKQVRGLSVSTDIRNDLGLARTALESTLTGGDSAWRIGPSGFCMS